MELQKYKGYIRLFSTDYCPFLTVFCPLRLKQVILTYSSAVEIFWINLTLRINGRSWNHQYKRDNINHHQHESPPFRNGLEKIQVISRVILLVPQLEFPTANSAKC